MNQLFDQTRAFIFCSSADFFSSGFVDDNRFFGYAELADDIAITQGAIAEWEMLFLSGLSIYVIEINSVVEKILAALE